MSPDPHEPQRRRSRQSRYLRAVERREAQARADQRFYRVIFGLISACVLVVLAVAAVFYSGALGEGGDSAIGDAPAQTAFLGLTALEWGGLAVVAVIGVFMWRRISRR